MNTSLVYQCYKLTAQITMDIVDLSISFQIQIPCIQNPTAP